MEATAAAGSVHLNWALADLDADASFFLERRTEGELVRADAQTFLTDLSAGRYRFDVIGLAAAMLLEANNGAASLHQYRVAPDTIAL